MRVLNQILLSREIDEKRHLANEPIVQNGKFSARAASDPTRALNSVLLPTFGRPTIPVCSFPIVKDLAVRKTFKVLSLFGSDSDANMSSFNGCAAASAERFPTTPWKTSYSVQRAV